MAAQAAALEDQAWAAARSLMPDIERIAHFGTNGTQRDDGIVKIMAHLVCGRLHMLNADADGK